MKKRIIEFLKRLFHIHNFETVKTLNSNSKGSTAVEICNCGKQRKIIQDTKGNHYHID